MIELHVQWSPMNIQLLHNYHKKNPFSSFILSIIIVKKIKSRTQVCQFLVNYLSNSTNTQILVIFELLFRKCKTLHRWKKPYKCYTIIFKSNEYLPKSKSTAMLDSLLIFAVGFVVSLNLTIFRSYALSD